MLLIVFSVMPFDDRLETFFARSRQQWRQWLETNHRLETNHLTSCGVWLVCYKIKSGKPSVRSSEAVKEALCFGWIDSKVQFIDAESYRQIFTPRQPQSV